MSGSNGGNGLPNKENNISKKPSGLETSNISTASGASHHQNLSSAGNAMLHSSITNALGGPSSLVKMSLKGREMGGSREFGKEITNAGSTAGGNGILSSTALHP